MKREMLTTDFIDRAADIYDDVTGIVAHDGTEYTYAEVNKRVNRLAHALSDRGVSKGSRVAVLAPNTHYFIETLYATNKLGAVFVPLNYRLDPAKIEYILNDCEAATVIADYDFAEKVQPVRDDIPAETFIGYEPDRIDGEWEAYSGILDGQPTAEPDRPDMAEDDDASINYTSGTTGDPKGVVRTHRTESWHALVLNQHMEIRDDDTYLWTLPMFHCNGWGHTYAITGTGGTHVCQRTFDAADTFRRVREYDVSFMCGAPTVLNKLIQHYRANDGDVVTQGDRDVRIATAGSAPATATIERVEDEFGWRIIHIYGLTETAPIITTSNSPRRIAERGRELKVKQGSEALCTDIRVVDEDGTDVPHDGTAIGEVVVQGNQVMDRYLNKPEITEEAFNDRVEGYFHTGDLATWDEDGMIQIMDRRKDIIISGGENISSIELEDELYDHPDVLKAAVIPAPSEDWGETPMAIVVPTADSDVTEQDILEFLRERVASYKVPAGIDFRDSLPETATGKIQKYELREEYWQEQERMIGQE
ncbi:AlkK [Haloarcula hispanica N601]|uniref:AlkK n=4 Tax=Halobacteriales TaxID=2235 RepID=V5TL84_HALHI|nr:long-chain-fatty-acid--CoA ligase [Haloarcula hispanica]AEM56473.1 medium-chain acyl-CoA ligase [Haloarcula hispanica ATCC 33960]AHB65284.1 AlkK [Haloarcula hispanica N601]KAA9409198.1 long-chain-fatty-acid--CoA ligase [Haloarcula hispanica]